MSAKKYDRRVLYHTLRRGLYHGGRRAHRDESGTEAVEWIAVGASLFMLAAILSMVLDLNGGTIGQSLVDQVSNVVGGWDNSRSAVVASNADGTVDIDSIETVASTEAAAAASSNRDALNESASFDISNQEDNAASDAESESATEAQANDENAGTEEPSTAGDLIIDGSQPRQLTTVGGSSSGEEKDATVKAGPIGEMWTKIGDRVRPVTDAVNQAFASMFRE